MSILADILTFVYYIKNITYKNIYRTNSANKVVILKMVNFFFTNSEKYYSDDLNY